MTPFLFDVRSELRQQVRRVAFLRKKTVYSSIFSLPGLVRAFDFTAHNQRFWLTLHFCSQVRVNGGRYIDLLRSRRAQLRARFASFNCIQHRPFTL